MLRKVAATWRMPSPQPSPTGEGADCSRFRRCRSSEKRMPETSTAGIFSGSLYRKAGEQTPQAFFQTTFEPKRQNVCRKARTRWVGIAEPLIPTATPSSLPWERARERATSRKACIGAVRVLGKIASIRGMPSPQPSPMGEGAGWSGFRRCRSSEKEYPKYQRQEFFR